MKLTLTNRHRSLRLPPSKWQGTVRRLYRSLSKGSDRPKPLLLEELSVVWLDDSQMADANWQFLRHRGPTDILTFDYGAGVAEILISLDTTRRQAAENNQTFEQELSLYLAHGLLH